MQIVEVLEYASKLIYPHVIYMNKDKDKKLGAINIKQSLLKKEFGKIPKTLRVMVEVIEFFPEGEEK